MSEKKPFWWPEPVNDEWRARIRADYPEETQDMDDDDIDDKYTEGWRYADTWDHLGDAREEYQHLADAFLKLVAETGKTPADFED
jgi:hypothetical protein